MSTLPNIVDMFLQRQTSPVTPTKVVNISQKVLTTEERVKLLEDTVAELVDRVNSLSETNNVKPTSKSIPIYTKLYSPTWFGKKEILEVTPFGYKILSTGITTNSLQQAAELVGAKNINYKQFWKMGSHDGVFVD